MREVRRPTAQETVQSNLHFRPGTLVARLQQAADFRLDPLHALLGWVRAQIPPAAFGKVAGSPRITKEIKAFPPSILHRGFRLVESQPELRHHRLRPRQRLFRATATKDDEVVGIRDEMCAKCFTTSSETPMLQKAIHINNGEQRADDSALSFGRKRLSAPISLFLSTTRRQPPISPAYDPPLSLIGFSS